MTIEKRCDWCGYQVTGPDSQGGQLVACPECAAEVLLPEAPRQIPINPPPFSGRTNDDELNWELEDEQGVDDFSLEPEDSFSYRESFVSCPMCGTGNSSSASFCESCGERLGNTPGAPGTGTTYLSPYAVKTYRQNVNAVGWILVLLGALAGFVAVVLLADLAPIQIDPMIPNDFFGKVAAVFSLVYLVLGILVFQKKNGAMLGALIVGYFLVFSAVLELSLCAGLIAFALVVSAHKARKLAKEIRAAGYPLTVHPREVR